MANILIIGAGSMGTAFSFPCLDNKHNVSIYGTHLENDFINTINSNRNHILLNCKVPEAVKFYQFQELSEKINNKTDLIVIAVASKGIDWASKVLSNILKRNIPILILTKGLSINNNKFEVLAHKMERILKKNGIKKMSISALGGPCLAKGLANKIHTSVIVANKSIKIAKKISKLISTDYYHVFTTNDVIGLEISSAIKNIFSIALGAASGLNRFFTLNEDKEKLYLNTSAALLQQSINEMTIFTKKLKGKKETVLGLAGVGDLYVSEKGGRNSKMGRYLGQGMTYNAVKKDYMKNETVEGADLILEIGSKVRKDFSIKELPLMFSIIDAIHNENPLTIKWNYFK